MFEKEILSLDFKNRFSINQILKCHASKTKFDKFLVPVWVC